MFRELSMFNIITITHVNFQALIWDFRSYNN